MKVYLKYLVFLAALLTMSGCALTNDNIVLNHQPAPVSEHALTVAKKIYLKVGPISDKPGHEPNLLLHKRDGFGIPMSGKYLLDKPMSKLVEETLAADLQNIGYTVTTGAAPYHLTGKIDSFKIGRKMGLVKGTVIMYLHTTLTLSKYDKQLLWSKTLTGQSQFTSTFGSDEELRACFNRALDDLGRQLQESASFHAAFQH